MFAASFQKQYWKHNNIAKYCTNIVLCFTLWNESYFERINTNIQQSTISKKEYMFTKNILVIYRNRYQDQIVCKSKPTRRATKSLAKLSDRAHIWNLIKNIKQNTIGNGAQKLDVFYTHTQMNCKLIPYLLRQWYLSSFTHYTNKKVSCDPTLQFYCYTFCNKTQQTWTTLQELWQRTFPTD